ncbi:MAG: glycosyltransferase, partial [Candidatus Methanomethylicia archaeon]
KYKNIEKAIYSIVEVTFFKIARIFLVSSYVIKKYVEKRVDKNKKVVYFPPSVPLSEIANICKTVNRNEFRRKLGFFDDDIIVTYVGNVEKEISGIDILTEALLKIETSNSFICERIKTILILAINDTAQNSLNMINRILQQMTQCKDSVRIFTNVKSKKVFEVLCASDFGLALLDPNANTSKQTDWPLKVAEYVASGLPIIYTPFGNIRSLLIDNIHGFEVSRNPNDILRVYSKIYLLRSSDLVKLKNAVVSLRKYVNIDNYSNIIFHTLLDEIRHS